MSSMRWHGEGPIMKCPNNPEHKLYLWADDQEGQDAGRRGSGPTLYFTSHYECDDCDWADDGPKLVGELSPE